MFSLRKLVVRYLREAADKIDAGTSEITEEESLDILKAVAHESLSKAQGCRHLNLSPQHFDALIRQGLLPNGRKIVGFKEKRWYADELDMSVYRMKKDRK